MSRQTSVLVIDDEEVLRGALLELLKREGYEVTTVSTADNGLALLAEDRFDLVLLDLMLPGRSGLSTLKEVRRIAPNVVVIMVTAYASVETAVEATKQGVFDFIVKPFKNDELLLSIRNGLAKRQLALENERLRKSLRTTNKLGNMVAKSRVMQNLFELMTQVAPHKSTVLITGESGTGKELAAKAIHQLSGSNDRPFVAVNAGAIPFDLLESELFGHVKGAFTGATGTKKGLFEAADGGTLFLDEIGNIPIDSQAKLLRALQEKEIRRVGDVANRKVDVRVVAATNSNLEVAVQHGRFRSDLYYRLNVIRVDMPPLRGRADDIPLLLDHFVARFSEENNRERCTINAPALKVLVEYAWPGNVRELENVVELAVVLAGRDNQITPQHLPRDLTEREAGTQRFSSENKAASLKEMVQEYERELIREALERNEWNQKRAADLLRIIPTTLHQKMKRLKIKIP